MKVHQRLNHVLPKRIWSFIYDHFELTVAEQRHLNVCLYCADIFKLCVTSENFDQMVREIRTDGDDISAAA
jgi:hypothetical protein